MMLPSCSLLKPETTTEIEKTDVERARQMQDPGGSVPALDASAPQSDGSTATAPVIASASISNLVVRPAAQPPNTGGVAPFAQPAPAPPPVDKEHVLAPWAPAALKKAVKKLLREDAVELWSRPYTDEVRRHHSFVGSRFGSRCDRSTGGAHRSCIPSSYLSDASFIMLLISNP
jgi:hypothetical protein